MSKNILLVDFDQAKDLKKLGFPQRAITSIGWYSTNGQLNDSSIDAPLDLLEGECTAPTLELVAKWLREEKNIHVCPIYYSSKTYKSEWYSCEVNQHQINDDEEYPTYEEALNAGIDKAIEILKL